MMEQHGSRPRNPVRWILITTGLFVVISVAGGLLLRRRAAFETSESRSATNQVPSARIRSVGHDASLGLPAWLGQPGLAARRVAGVVTHKGHPVAGAVVSLDSRVTFPGAMHARVVGTGEDGHFDFGVQPASRYP